MLGILYEPVTLVCSSEHHTRKHVFLRKRAFWIYLFWTLNQQVKHLQTILSIWEFIISPKIIRVSTFCMKTLTCLFSTQNKKTQSSIQECIEALNLRCIWDHSNYLQEKIRKKRKKTCHKGKNVSNPKIAMVSLLCLPWRLANASPSTSVSLGTPISTYSSLKAQVGPTSLSILTRALKPRFNLSKV